MYSTIDQPRFEFAFECRLRSARAYSPSPMSTTGLQVRGTGGYGSFEGPRLRGRAIANSGGDYAHFRADDTAVFDARYLLEVDDGTMIYMQNRGFLWGRTPDAMTRLRAWAFEGGPPVPHEDYYLRAQPTFETPKGKHDWLTRHVFVGIGERRPDGNLVRYYAVT